MTAVPDFIIQTYFGGDRLPPEAKELFGEEVERAWTSGATAAEGVSPERALPVCVAATTDGQWLAGVFMLLEIDHEAQGAAGGDSEGEKGQRVASVRHLIIPPAHRGRGLAGRLIRRAISVASEAGAARIRSTAGWGCPDHLMIYDRMGFGRADGVDRPYLVSRDLADHGSNAT